MTQSAINTLKEGDYRIQYLAQFECPELQRFFKDPDGVLQQATKKIYKATFGDTTTVVVVRLGQKQYVVKRYNLKGFFHQVKRRIRPSKARESWVFANRLQALQIPSVQPVAIVEKRLGCFYGEAYFVSTYIEGMLGRDYFAVDSPMMAYWPATLQKISNLLGQLKNHGLLHKDFQYGNILIVDHQPVLLDLDHMSHMDKTDAKFLQLHQKDVAHFKRFLKVNHAASEIFDRLHPC